MKDTTANLRKCTGPCRRELPETEEFYYLQRRTGKYEPCCKRCKVEAILAKRRRTRGSDGLDCAVRQTQRKIKEAFHRMDPGGSREDELRRRLSGIVKQFGAMPYATRVATFAWFVTVFLSPSGEEGER